MPLFHLTLATDRRRVLCPTLAALRSGVRALERVAGDEMLLFTIVDDHLHLVIRSERRRAGYLGAAVRLAFAARSADRPLGRADVRPVEGRGHLLYLVRTYLPAQPAKHGLSSHPALYEGSGFLDLCGARALGGWSGTLLAQELPRFRLRDVFPAVQLEASPIEPLDPPRIHLLGAERLAEASRSALATDARGKDPRSRAARCAGAAIARECGLGLDELALAYGLSVRSIQRAAAREPDTRHVRAIRMRLALEERCATGTTGCAPALSDAWEE